MTYIVNDTASRVNFTATAGQTEFTIPFEFAAKADLVVYREGELLTLSSSPADNTEYSVTGAASNGTRKITLGSPGASEGDDILVFRDIANERLTNFPNSGPFSIASLNAELNQITMKVKDLHDRLENRTLSLSHTDSPEAMTSLPALALRSGMVLGFDDDGNPHVYTVGELSDQYASVVARMKVVNPMENRFGGVGDGVTNDDDALDAALEVLVVGGGVLQLTNLHRITGSRTITSDYPIAIYCNDPKSSGFVHSGNGDAIILSIPTWGDWAPHVRNVGFWKTGNGTNGCALTLRSETDIGDALAETSGSRKGGTVEGCYIASVEGESGHWEDGIYLHNMPHTNIFNNWISGGGGLTQAKEGYGIKLGHFCNGGTYHQNKIRGFEFGIGTYETEFFDQPARANSTAYVVGDRITVATGSGYLYVFTCEQAGTSAGSEPAAYATAAQNQEITDGTAIFESSGYQSEGLVMFANTISNCDYGICADIRDTEVAWKLSINSIDVAKRGIKLRNLSSCTVVGNSLGWNGGHKDHVDVEIRTDDGLASPTTTADDNAVTVITGNYGFRGGDMTLNVTGVTRGATTVIAYSKGAADRAPADGDRIMPRNLGGTTQINDLPFTVANHSALSSTTGTFEIKDPYTGAAINSSGYGAWTSGGNVQHFSAFLEVAGGQEVLAYGNIFSSRSCELHLWPATQDVFWLDNRPAAAVLNKIISASTSPTSLRFRRLDDVMQMRQTATRTLTSNTSAQAIFNAAAAGAFTLEVGDVVDIDMLVTLSALSSSSSTFSFGLGGTATLSELAVLVLAGKEGSVGDTRFSMMTSASATIVTTASTSTAGVIRVTGSFKCTVAGTVIPQITQSVAAAAVVGIGSYCRLTKQPPVQTYGNVT
jgi:hypothetical protein